MTARSPLSLVNGLLGELPQGDLALGGGLVKTSVDTGLNTVIPSGYQYLVWGSFQVNGSCQVDGMLVVL